MATTSKTKVSETLKDFLFSRIKNDAAYAAWSEEFAIPQYITDNLTPSKGLRAYQQEAVKYFIYLFESGRRGEAKHLLFNMATGTGKTFVMAACVLYLYEKGYRNFLFLVHQVQILEQARKNFTDYKFEKYLFNPAGVKFHGRIVRVREVSCVQDAAKNDINFMFYSTSLLYGRLKEEAENSITYDDFKAHDMVIIADEAHRLNVETRGRHTQSETEEVLNWERAVMGAIQARPGNMLLEFTATVDLANDNIRTKYKDKIVYKYDFLEFNKDGYSKDVKFLYNYETQIEDQKKYLIVNAVALSQYRKLLFRQLMKAEVNPVVLVKSKKIAHSEEDRKFFNAVIEALRPADLEKLRHTEQDDFGLVATMFAWLHNNRIPLDAFVATIKQDFTPGNTLIYNSQKKERPELLAELDSPRNTVRAIFSVNALNEGWDVLSLFDIIHFDISETKKVSLQDIQLIGRGARYCPFELPGTFQDNMFGSYETDAFKRKFDNSPLDEGRVLETFFYHFVHTGTFLEKLQEELLGEGIINEGVERKTIRLKPAFLESETYKRGFVLVNHTVKRERTSQTDIDLTFKKTINASTYQLRARGLTDIERSGVQAALSVSRFNIFIDFPIPIIKKALMAAEHGFFRFNNLREHVVNLESIDDFIVRYLSLYTINYEYEKGKEMHNLTPQEKLQLLVGVILPEVRKAIDIHLPTIVGGSEFRPVPIRRVFEQEKTIFCTAFPVVNPVTGEKEYRATDERFQAQSSHPDPELRLDVHNLAWYGYDENYGTTEEKRFVKFMHRTIGQLQEAYPGAEIYLVRNELDYWVFSPKDGRRFSPDYVLFIHDARQKTLYYQCVIEVKGGHLLDKDKWKEEAVLGINDGAAVRFGIRDEEAKLTGGRRQYGEYLHQVREAGYRQIKNIGLKFYNTDPRDESEFTLDFQSKLLDR